MAHVAIKPYRWLAVYYDEFFWAWRRPIDAARESLLREIMPGVASACDLACGPGYTALTFAAQGVETYAVDLSPAMCRLAREKAKRASLALRVIRADMRDFRLPSPVDLVTCEYDALNHVPRKADLAKVARAVARALGAGGHFYFDVNNSPGFARYWKGVVWIERPGVILAMRNGHNKAADRAWCDVEWFVRQGTLWKRHRERVEEVCWSEEEIRTALERAGFDRVLSWDAAPFFQDPLIGPGCRTVYLARKMPHRGTGAGFKV